MARTYEKKRNRMSLIRSECHLGKWDDLRVAIVDKVDLDVAGSWVCVGHCGAIPHSISIPDLIIK